MALSGCMLSLQASAPELFHFQFKKIQGPRGGRREIHIPGDQVRLGPAVSVAWP